MGIQVLELVLSIEIEALYNVQATVLMSLNLEVGTIPFSRKLITHEKKLLGLINTIS